MKNIILKNAAINAFLAALYVVAIGSFLFYVPKYIGKGQPDTVFIPIFMLSLLVFSAALMGVLIFGRPITWYLDNKKREALSLLGYTLGVFFLITIFLFALLYITSR